MTEAPPARPEKPSSASTQVKRPYIDPLFGNIKPTEDASLPPLPQRTDIPPPLMPKPHNDVTRLLQETSSPCVHC